MAVRVVQRAIVLFVITPDAPGADIGIIFGLTRIKDATDALMCLIASDTTHRPASKIDCLRAYVLETHDLADFVDRDDLDWVIRGLCEVRIGLAVVK